ncbi:FixH family protein [Rhabdobacter roseus]|uniref:FixH family protein n=1 Tax=Rhabdobacter roseus TaxID=1655419 RepID=A0A840TIK7_9BACT|nr:FixH family protein [Rhabdobacter roseus]MBB5282775.1 hypothetical protein [Rhabdobacter roseus]
MKLNWGTGIALLYISFVVGMLTLVTMSTRQKIDLVADNYYEQELGFQKKIDKQERANALSEKLRWEVTQAGILIKYPSALLALPITGNVKLYCPSDNRKDAQFAVQPDASGEQLIPAAKLQPGRYQLQIDWQAGDTTYWNEGTLGLSK